MAFVAIAVVVFAIVASEASKLGGVTEQAAVVQRILREDRSLDAAKFDPVVSFGIPARLRDNRLQTAA